MSDARPLPLLDRRLLFVTGKGGTGKTTVAAALAQLAADRGKRVLACEVDAKGDLAALFEAGPTDFTGREVASGVVVMSMDTEESLREYLKLYLRIPVVGGLGPLARALDFVAAAAPGVREILTVGKLCHEVRERNFDLVVVDAAATGHIVGQLAAPQAINDLVKVGLIRSQTDWMLEILSDPRRTGLVAVTTPEEMPVNETLELAARIRAETTVQLCAVVVNRVLPELFGLHEEEVFDRVYAHAEQLSKLLGGDADPLMQGARLAVTLRRTRAGHLRRLRRGLGSEVAAAESGAAATGGGAGAVSAAPQVLYVPYLFSRAHGLRSMRQVAQSLGEELGL
ncbi:MAG TPA: ArsA-related P-loop ATPase [Acidimicrobiales bacterium]|nr:ArsA-related P-loop ATPase [Acidimicrobiales bacterium]